MAEFSFSQKVNFDALCMDLKGKNFREIYAEMLSALDISEAERSRFFNYLCKREESGYVYACNGVAVLVVRILDPEGLSCCLGVSHDGVEWDFSDGEPVRLYILIVADMSLCHDYFVACTYLSKFIKRRDLIATVLNAATHEQMRLALLSVDEQISEVMPQDEER